MKLLPKIQSPAALAPALLLAAVVVALVAAPARAQNSDIFRSLPANKLDATLPTPEKPAFPVVSMALKHNEALRTFDVAVQSDDAKPIQVYGVQTTAGLFVVDYPKVLTAKGKSTVTLIYVAKLNSSGSTDLLTLLTERGEKTVQIDHGRELVAAFDQTALSWKQGESAVAKNVVITMTGTTSVPKNLRVMGPGNTAKLTALGGGRYQVSVTPASTAKPQVFPIFVEFVPALPGVNTLISCTVESAN